MQILEKSKPQIPVEPIKTDSSVMQMPVMIEQAIGPH
jgi:hypothetical protein